MDNPIWIDMMQDPYPNYVKTKRAFDLYFSMHDEYDKGSGAKQFRRWEHRVRDRVDPAGNVIWFKGQEEALRRSANLRIQGGLSGGIVKPAAACPEDGDWRLVGPINRPYNQSGQPNGTGRINTVAFHPTDSTTYFGCSPQGGLWKSTDAGQSWSMIFGTSTGINSVGVSSVAINPSNTSIMYLGTGDIDAGDAPGYGVMKSINAGKTWTLSNTGMGNRTVGRIIIDPTNAAILLASTNAGVYRSTNSGSSWVRTSISTKATDLVFKPGNSSYVYAAFSNGSFYRSTNNGVNWTRITSGLPTTGLQRGQIAVSEDDSNYVYLVIAVSSRFKGLYRSTNSGTSFTTRSTTPNILGYSNTGNDTKGQGWYDLDIAVSPINKDEVFVIGINIWKSTNGGSNWTISGHWTGQSSDDVHADHHGLEYSKSGYQLLNGNDGGVYISSDGGSVWKNINSNISNSQIYRMAQAQTNEFFSNHGYQDNGSAVTDKNESYTYWGGDGTDALVDPTDHKYIYGAYVRGSIYRVYDKTTGKTIANNGTGGVNETGAWVTPFVLQEGNTKRFFAGYKNIWRTDDVRAATPAFVKISNNLAGSNTRSMRYLENSPADAKILYALRDDNKLFRTDDATVSSPSWTDLSAGMPSSPRWVESHPTNSNIVYLAANNRVYRSSNKGATWTSSVTITSSGGVKCLVFDKTLSGENLYVGTERGICHVTFSGGSGSWLRFESGFPTWSDVTDIDMYNSPKGKKYSHVIVSTYGRGVWKSAIRDFGTSKPEARAYTFDSILSVGGHTKLYDNSRGSISGRTWTISPSSSFSYINGTSASSPEPEIRCSKAGVLKVALTVSNCQGSSTLTKSNWIRVFPSAANANCTPTTTARSGNVGIGILNVELTDNNSETGLFKHDDEYTDYSKSKTFRLSPSTTYTARIKAGTFNNTRVRMSIDYDNNGKFETSNNEILTVSPGTKGYRNYIFTTPSNLKKNQSLRMRITSDFSSSMTNPCGNSIYGDAEDYSVLYDYVKAGFSASKTKVCLNENTVFTDTSEGYAGEYVWDFGSGASPATAMGKGPHTVSYTSTGNKTVKLTLDGSSVETRTSFIEVSGFTLGTATVSRTLGSKNPCALTKLHLKASFSKALSGNQTYQWQKNGINILGETDSTLEFSSILVSDNGSYRCIISEGYCSAQSNTYAINVAPLPVAKFSKSADMCLKNNTFRFTDQSTSSGSGNSITTRKWTFGTSGAQSSQINPSYSYASSGTYTVSLEVTTALGCKSNTQQDSVTVFPQTSMSFTINNNVQCFKGNSFIFTNGSSISSGSFSSAWAFGDGSSSSSSSPSKTYSIHNNYDVLLVATSNQGCKDSIQKQVTVKASPTAEFTINDATQCLKGNNFVYTNTSTLPVGTNTYKWTYGDGGTGTSTNGVRTYGAASSYNVMLIASSNLSCLDSITKVVQIYEQSSPSFTINDKEQCFAGHIFTFTNTTPGAGLLNFRWMYGNGSLSSGINGAKKYNTYGRYDVLLVSTTSNNCKDSIIKSVVVRDQPKASLTLNDAGQCLKGNNFVHVSTSTCADALSNIWDYFSGTTTANGLNLKYTSEGRRNVKLVSRSIYGCADSVSIQNTVHPQTTLNFSINQEVQCFNGHRFNFTNTSINTESFKNRWSFGDNTFRNSTSASKQYALHGSYQVSLFTNTVNNCLDTLIKNITVNASPKAGFSADKSQDCERGNQFSFTNNSTILAGSNTYNWNNGEGVSANSTNLSTSYSTFGTYTVKLLAQSDQGCLDSISQDYVVHASPIASLTSDELLPRCEGELLGFTNRSTLANGTMRYSWDDDNGTIKSSTNFSTIYPNHGSYALRLIVTSDKDCEDQVIFPVAIASIPKSSFTINPQPGCANQTEFDFNSTSTNADGKALSYEYIYGDGNTANQASNTHKYTVANTYSIDLKVRSSICADSTNNTLLVLPPVSAAFSMDSLNQEAIRFYALDSNSSIPYTYNWLISDGTSQSVQGFNHTFASNKRYTIKLVVDNNQNCMDSFSRTFVLESANYKLQDNAINFYIYPNPTAGKFTYKFEISEKRPVEVKLLTIDGRELWSRDWGELDAGVYYESLDFGQMDVSNGTYPFQIKSKDDVEQIKIIFSN